MASVTDGTDWDGEHLKVSDNGTTEVPEHVLSRQLQETVEGINRSLVNGLLEQQETDDCKDDPDDTGEFLPFALSNPLEGTSDYEVPLADDGTWVATHKIGDTVVMQKHFSNAMRYWVTEDGTRRRPTARNPLLPLIDLPTLSQRIRIPMHILGLITEAMENDRSGDPYGNVVEKKDDKHAILSLYSRETEMHTRYIVSVVEYVELIGKQLNQ